jgi:lipooligosaccharide transport system permease protein
VTTGTPLPTRSAARGAWRGTLRVTEYRMRNMWKWRNSIIAFGLGNPVLFLASVGLGVGLLVDESSGGVDGVPYLVFLAPALLAAAAIQGGQDEVTFPTIAGFIWEKLFFAMRATSLTGGQIADGVFLAAAVRVVFTTTLYWLVLFAFGAVDGTSALPLIAVSTFAGLCWGALMLAVSANITNADAFFAIAWRLIIMPMFLFSGTFYPLSSLPLALQWIGWISPLWHATQLGRWLSYGMPLEPWQAIVSIVYLLAMGVVGIVLARRRFERRLTA